MSKRRELWGIEAANPRTARGFSRAIRMVGARMRDRLVGRMPPKSAVSEDVLKELELTGAGGVPAEVFGVAPRGCPGG